MTRLYQQHAIVVRFDVHKADVVILKSETMDLVWCLSSSLPSSVEFFYLDEPMDVARLAPQGDRFHVVVSCCVCV